MDWVILVFGSAFIRAQGPITVLGPEGVYSEPEPDIVVTRNIRSAYDDHHPTPDDLLLVAEVSDTTRRFDLTTKARLYARAGVTEYWTLDITARQLHIHRKPANGKYTAVSVHSETETVATLARPEQQVCIADLLPPVQETAENA